MAATAGDVAELLDVDRRTGPPISVGISGAHLHGSQALISLVKGTPPIRSRRGLSALKPGKLRAHKGYDYPTCGDDYVGAASSKASRRGIENFQRLGRHGWTIERAMA
ncbi:hypothetical protein OHB29_15730 [Streptomyces violaceus]|uniref:Uncharacterized protein n=1 Tax=Streptomyces violaceus TaxID=1936 RepID=A0ABZ1NSC1_STRVL